MAEEAEAVSIEEKPEATEPTEVEAPEAEETVDQTDDDIVDPFDAADDEIPDATTKNAAEEPDAGGAKEEGDEEDAEEAEAEEEKPPVIPEELLYRAEQVGFTKEEALEFGNPKLLEMAIKRATPVAPAAQPKKEEAPAAEDADELKLLEMKPEDGWDADVIKQFAAVKDFASKQTKELKALKAQFEEVHAFVSEQNRKAVNQRLIGHFEKAAEQYGDIFGKGDMHEISGINRVNRIKVVSEVHALAEGYRSTGQKVPEEKILIERAMRNLFGEDAKKKITKEIAGKVTKRNKNLIARPSHKKGSPNLPPEQAAVKALESKFGKLFQAEEPDTF